MKRQGKLDRATSCATGHTHIQETTGQSLDKDEKESSTATRLLGHNI